LKEILEEREEQLKDIEQLQGKLSQLMIIRSQADELH